MTTDEIHKKFKTGTRVLVTQCLSYKKADYTGRFGTVRRNAYAAYGKILVDLDGVHNPYGATGSFYFKPYELAIVTVEEILDNDIKEEKIMENISNYLNIAKVRRVSERGNYRCDCANFDSTLTAGDLCVVAMGAADMYVGIVDEIIEKTDADVTREIVVKVDTESYSVRVAARKEAAELKAKMEERAKKLQDIALYQMLAKDDSEMQELLNRFQNLPKY